MNQQEKAQRYDWLLNEYKKIESQITQIPRLPLEQTLQDVNSAEYTPENLIKVNNLKNQQQRIDLDVKRLF
jgi:hypothetical protein|tara:strand:- start:375 stop:587 length:213 start_codon:yes stop_codon:yes gene_type:complete